MTRSRISNPGRPRTVHDYTAVESINALECEETTPSVLVGLEAGFRNLVWYIALSGLYRVKALRDYANPNPAPGAYIITNITTKGR